MADKPQAVLIDPNSPEFDAPDHAADAVSKTFGNNQSAETAAVIIKKPNGKYVYSTVAPQATHDEFAVRAMFPKGYALGGIVHSHPGADDLGQVFSPGDINTAKQLNVPSFVRFINNGQIRKYVPGVTNTQMSQVPGSRSGVTTAIGDPLLAVPPPQPTAPVATTAATVPVDGQRIKAAPSKSSSPSYGVKVVRRNGG